ncbi:hypothetical protein TI39_contig594g00025 [Zymoseptoria brevis]|uniref:Uncharacterized protein n=1 Tax=Zymoseptoria brevis TaxID=1047168 RepID=A0A0F4GI38_9PEZI|nr:hypothetical protein TI39_contig594g00025 [Zymoseptoria brevis]
MGSSEREMHWTLMQKRREALLSISWMEWDSKRCVAAWDRATEAFLSELRVQLRRMIPEDSPGIATELDSTPKHRNSKQKTGAQKHHIQDTHPSGKNTSKGDKSKNDKPKNDKPKNDKPKNDKPKNDKLKNDKPKNDKPKNDNPKQRTPKSNTPTPSKPKQSTARQLIAKEACQPNKPVPIRTYMVDYAGMSISMATASASSGRSTKTTVRPTSSRQAEHIISSAPATDPNATSIAAKELRDPRCQPPDKCTSRDRTSEEKVAPTTTTSASSTASSRKIIRRVSPAPAKDTKSAPVPAFQPRNKPPPPTAKRESPARQRRREHRRSTRGLIVTHLIDSNPSLSFRKPTFPKGVTLYSPDCQATTELNVRKEPEGTHSARPLRRTRQAMERAYARKCIHRQGSVRPLCRNVIAKKKALAYRLRHPRKQIERPRSAEVENRPRLWREMREQNQRRRAEIEQILLKEFDGAAKDLPVFPRLRRPSAAVGAWELADEVLDFVAKR